MLQLTNFYQQCFNEFQKNNCDLFDINHLFCEIDQKHELIAKNNLIFLLDKLIWTHEEEFIDDPHFDMQLKKEVIQGLHLKNKVFGTYTKVIETLGPLVEEINQTQNRPARILELGSGMGKLTMAIYNEFKNSTLQVQLTGSDIVAEYIDSAKKEAQLKNYDIDFKVIDAFSLETIESDSYDLVFTLHSMHHFSPTDLGLIIKGALKISTKGFIGIDGYRGLSNLLFIMLSGAGKSLISQNYVFFHDAFTSGRKMYAAKQLEFLGKLSCPNAFTSVENLRPGLTVLKTLKACTSKVDDYQLNLHF